MSSWARSHIDDVRDASSASREAEVKIVPGLLTSIDAEAIGQLRREALPIGTKGLPLGRETLTIEQVAEAGWNVLGGDLPLPLLTLSSSALRRNVRRMATYCHERGAAFGVARIFYADEVVEPAALRFIAAELRRDPTFETYFLVDSATSIDIERRD